MTTKKNYNIKPREYLEGLLDSEGLPIDEPIENLLDLVAEHPTVLSEQPREKRFFYLHPLAWAWLEILAEHQGLSVTEYIEQPLRQFGEPSLEALRWISNRRQKIGLRRSTNLPWGKMVKGKGLNR